MNYQWIVVWIPLRWGVLDTTLCYKDCQRLATGRWFSLGTSVSSTNKTDGHNITEILLKMTLSTINQPTISELIVLKYIHFILTPKRIWLPLKYWFLFNNIWWISFENTGLMLTQTLQESSYTTMIYNKSY